MDYLLDLSAGDHTIIRDMIVLFLEQTPKDLNALAAHIADGNWPGTQSMAHHIKPTLGYVGAESMKQEIQHIEQLARLPEVPGKQLSDRFETLSGRFDTLIAELKVYLDSLP